MLPYSSSTCYQFVRNKESSFKMTRKGRMKILRGGGGGGGAPKVFRHPKGCVSGGGGGGGVGSNVPPFLPVHALKGT